MTQQTERQRIGAVHKIGGTWRAVCELPHHGGRCDWYWQGAREQALDHLRNHADIAHPQPIPVYREVVTR